MTSVRKLLAVLAIAALANVRPAAAQQAFISDVAPARYQADMGSMEGEPVQPKRMAAAQQSADAGGWGDQSCRGECSGDSCGNCDSCRPGCGLGNCLSNLGCNLGCGMGCCGNSCGNACPCGSGCGSEGDCEDDCTGISCSGCRRPHGGWYLGGGAVWAKPFFQHNTALVTSGPGTTFDNVTAEVPFQYDYEVTPRAWVGYENSCGFGVRGRYWEMDQSAAPVSFTENDTAGTSAETTDSAGFIRVATIGDGDVLSVNSSMRLHVADLEATQRFTFSRCELVGSIGARYAHVEQDFSAIDINVNSVTETSVHENNEFEGGGFTMALDGRRPCGCSGFALVAGCRGSILFGTRNVNIQALDASDSVAVTSELTRDEAEVLAIGEINGGIEWSHCFPCGARLFSQAMAEGQIWDGTGNAGFSTQSNLGVLGFGVTAGIVR